MILHNAMNSGLRIVPILFLLLIPGCSGLRIERSFRPGPNDWTLAGGSAARSNAATVSLKPPLEEVWEYNALAGITATPLVRDSMMVVVTLNGELQVVNVQNGKRMGYVVLESAIAGTPALDGSAVIIPVAGGNETIVSLSLRNSERNWKANVGPIESSLLLDDDHVYLTTMQGFAYCLKKNDGKEVWKFATGTEELRKPVRSSPATDGQDVFFGCDDGFVYALDRTTGALRWKYNTGAPVFASPIVAGQSVLVGTLGGILYNIKTSTGAVQWKFDAGSPIYGNAATGSGRVFFGSSDGNGHALDLSTGARLWRFSTRSVINSPPLISGDLLYWGSMDRTLYALDAQSGRELWNYSALGRIKVPPVLWGNLLLVTSEDKFIVALKPTS